MAQMAIWKNVTKLLENEQVASLLLVALVESIFAEQIFQTFHISASQRFDE